MTDVRPGRGKGLGAALLLCALALAIAPVAHADAGAGSTTALTTGQPPAARAADTLKIFTITGTSLAARINAFTGPGGRLTVVSPEGITEPDGANPECTQDGPTQVSCMPGYIGAIAGDLKDGSDTFTAAPTLDVSIGIVLAGVDNPLSGGGGRDSLSGGPLNDLIDGGAGPDTLLGNGLSDLLRGGPSRDSLVGGTGPDALYGGGGPDRLDGGPARDLCNGGGGADIGLSCLVSKKIP
jgi:Ca2+-binding RTX toxin-like protein